MNPLIKLENGSSKMLFEKGDPFKPLEQLLGVLPPQSSKFLPQPYQTLMIDPTSPIFQYYPTIFKIEQRDPKIKWDRIAHLPFIDDQKLLETVQTVSHHLSETEKKKEINLEKIFIINMIKPLIPFNA